MKKISNSECLSVLQVLLASLRAAHLIHWTGHWQVAGPTQYGDHLLLERIYGGLTDDIDGLAEKIVAEYESDSVDPVDQIRLMHELTCTIVPATCNSLMERSLLVEEYLQKVLSKTYNYLKQAGYLSLGMDDFIMATADKHDTFVYLLRQRTCV